MRVIADPPPRITPVTLEAATPRTARALPEDTSKVIASTQTTVDGNQRSINRIGQSEQGS